MNEDINIGAITEALNNKVDLPSAPPRGQDEIDYVVDWQRPTEENSYTWYRRYKSGWVEQGGQYDSGSLKRDVSTTITLPIEMQDTNYVTTISLLKKTMNVAYRDATSMVCGQTTTQIAIGGYGAGTSDTFRYINWQVLGYAA